MTDSNFVAEADEAYMRGVGDFQKEPEGRHSVPGDKFLQRQYYRGWKHAEMLASANDYKKETERLYDIMAMASSVLRFRPAAEAAYPILKGWLRKS